MKKFKRVFCIVIDSVGIGGAVDANKFGDEGANTLGNISKACNGINLPTLEKLGLGHLTEIKGVSSESKPTAYVTRLAELSNGKDTMTGHWEMMGVHTTKPFITFTDTGFPKELIDELEKATGRKVIGNYASSGTVILDELGEEQIATGSLIVYTSADSVLQIAANEEYIPLEELYSACEKAREITMKDEWLVGRIIARPYIGHKKGEFKRTANRHDYALTPPHKTALNTISESGLEVISVGKISDIFNGYGVTSSNHISSNHDGMTKVMEIAKKDFNGLCFVNLVDFDALYGHRRDANGYKMSLEEFDKDLGELINILGEDDLLMVTADHGNDPTYKGTDHTRENVPLVVYYKGMDGKYDNDIHPTFAVIGQTILENFSLEGLNIGYSLQNKIK